MVCTQAESVWVHMEIIQTLAGMCSQVGQGLSTVKRILQKDDRNHWWYTNAWYAGMLCRAS